MRINKAFRSSHSRRESDRLVADGRVTVNGRRAGAGDRLFAGDVVALDGVAVAWEALQAELVADSEVGPLPLEADFVYAAYNKPLDVTCTTDSSVRGSLVAQPVARAFRGLRFFSVGRLDKESTGCLLLTNDGRIPNAVLRAAAGKSKVYRVTAESPVSEAAAAELAAGVVITTVAQRDGRAAPPLTARTLPCKVERVDAKTLLVTLQEGRNRQLRKMYGALGLTVTRLHRMSFLGIGVDGLPPGGWRSLTAAEMTELRRAVRAAGNAQGGAAWDREEDE